jgi:glycosyltransferase involved in cell wall biosynthesis
MLNRHFYNIALSLLYRALSKQIIRRFLIKFIELTVYFQSKMWSDGSNLSNITNLKLKYIHDLTSLTYEFLQGHSAFNTHSFAKILGESKQISLIYPHYNKEEDLLRSIESLKTANGYDPRLHEIIVVDDGSNVEMREGALPPEVIYLRRNKFGYGISRSRNLGAKISSGKILMFPDPDLIFPKNFFHYIMEVSSDWNRHQITSFYLEDYFYSGCPDPRVAFGVWKNPDRRTSRFFQLAGAAFIIDRKLFFDTGGFDEDLIYGEVEDTLFGYLLSLNPSTFCVFTKEVVLRHLPHEKGLAHANPSISFRVAAAKYPEFYDRYVLQGER